MAHRRQRLRHARKDACRPSARIAATESGLVHSSVIVTGGNRQAMRRAIEANRDLSFWHQALETERLSLRLLPGPLLSQEGLLWELTAG